MQYITLNLKGGGHAKIIADFLDKYLAWIVLKSKISFVILALSKTTTHTQIQFNNN